MSLLGQDIEVLYRLILQSTAEGICGLDRNGRIVFINRAGASSCGYRPEELIGQVFHEVLHYSQLDGESLAEADCAICAARTDEAVHTVTSDIFWRKDGTSFPVEYTCSPIRQENELTGLVVVFSDITGRKQAEAEMRHRDAIVEASDNAIASFSLEGKILSWNTGAEDLYGYRRSEIIGEPFEQLVAEEDQKALKEFLDTLKKGKDIQQKEMKHVTKAGKKLTFPLLFLRS